MTHATLPPLLMRWAGEGTDNAFIDVHATFRSLQLESEQKRREEMQREDEAREAAGKRGAAAKKPPTAQALGKSNTAALGVGGGRFNSRSPSHQTPPKSPEAPMGSSQSMPSLPPQ